MDIGLRSKNLRPLFGIAVVLAGILYPRSLQAQVGNTPPPLGQFIHSFDIVQPEATAYAIWNEGRNQRHEVWFRVIGGEALFQQRLQVYKEQAPPRTPDMLPPASELVYDKPSNNQTEWIYLGSENSFYTYYFDGDNQPVSAVNWDNAEAVRVTKTIYSSGDLYVISFEDLNLLDDYDDLVIEVVLVRR